MKNRLTQFWDEEHILTALLILLIVNMFVVMLTSRSSHRLETTRGIVFSVHPVTAPSL